MQGGFSFCGVDIATLGLEYVPEKENTYVYSNAAKQIQEQKIEAHDGGYFYGVSTAPKDFFLRCYYENNDVRDGIISQINACFKIGKTGKLIFAKRPWCWYTATVIETDITKMLNHYNGIITIKLRAYYPYARSEYMSISEYDENERDILLNSGVLTDSSKIPPTSIIASGSTMTQQNAAPILLYNPGTERAKVAIEIAGSVGDGVEITNDKTQQLCKFVVMTAAETTSENKWVVCDSLNGKTILTNGSTSELKFLYHDNGFLELEPAYPIIRDVIVQHTNGSNSLTILSADPITDVVGKFIYVDSGWKKITAQPSETTLTINENASSSGITTTEIVTMNCITVTPKSTMSLSKLNFVYKPTYS